MLKIELKKRRPAVDASKCDAKGIPRGPLIGQMIKNGHVTLQDGTVVKLGKITFVLWPFLTGIIDLRKLFLLEEVGGGGE